ncbi:MAG: ornithine cyclodeaminase [Rhizobiaceae bacterium]
MVSFVGTEDIIALVNQIGMNRVFHEIVDELEIDFRRWPEFEKVARVASHSPDGVIELMPVSDGETYGLKFVNGHPKNTATGLRTVTAFGLLADVETGYPTFLAEMTITTALRTAATSALAAKYLARKDSKVMAIIGLGAQSEFQSLAFKAILGINSLRVFDVDEAAAQKFARNMADTGIEITYCETPEAAVAHADIITTVTADKRNATILTDNMVGSGVHINGVGGDCPGKTELHRDILLRSSIFTEFTPQTRIEGEIQQLPDDHQVTELWEVISGDKHGRTSEREITLFDSVGFAIEDFTTLRVVRRLALEVGLINDIDLLPRAGDPKDLYGLIRSGSNNHAI